MLSAYYYSTNSRPPVTRLSEQISARFEGNAQTWVLAGPYDNAVPLAPDEMLARAKHNLRSCVVVGLTERFDETLLLLRKAFGWRWPFYVRRNVNRTRPPKSAIPVEILRQIEADNALDMALYEYARELFEEQIAAYGSSFERDLKTFRILNSVWQRWHKGLRSFSRMFGAFDRRVWPLFEPIYRACAPRVVSSQAPGDLQHRLYMGKFLIGQYRPQRQEWKIRRPFRLFIDEDALPHD
jgi:hypothetical protein